MAADPRGTPIVFPIVNRAPLDFEYCGNVTCAELLIDDVLVSTATLAAAYTYTVIDFLGGAPLRTHLLSSDCKICMYAVEASALIQVTQRLDDGATEDPVIIAAPDGTKENRTLKYQDGKLQIL